MSEEIEPIRRIEVMFNDDREPVDTIDEATWKYVTIFDEDGEIEEQYSVPIIDGVDQEYVEEENNEEEEEL